jgi:cob(I)alamin adenosyltransferase
VLDEINVALWFELVPITDVLELLDRRPEDVELVLTGRRAPEELLERADLVTEMKSVRHYYDSGVKARKGIEY